MRGVNKVILIGNLGADPEVRNFESGSGKVANIRIATNRTYKDREGNQQTETEWHTVVLWGKLADIAEEYLRKGNAVYVEGRLRTRQWTDKDGNTRYTTEVVATDMTMLGGSGGGQVGSPVESTATNQPSETKQPPIDDQDDDLPF